MISQANKFATRTKFLAFRKTAKQLTIPHLRLLYGLSPTTSHLSIIVPKKLSKLATTRNWLKRLTYDTLWPQIQDQKIDCIVIYKPLALKKSGEVKKMILSEISTLDLK